MVKRQCIGCKRILPPHHIGRLCPVCQIEALEKTTGTSPIHYNIKDLMEILGYSSEEHMRRLSRKGKILGKVPIRGRHIFFRNVVDEWIRRHQVIPKEPTNPLQEEAKAKCDKKDHSWLFDEKYNGIAYSSEDAAIQQSEKVISVGYNRTCYFCGYSMFVSTLYNF